MELNLDGAEGIQSCGWEQRLSTDNLTKRTGSVLVRLLLVGFCLLVPSYSEFEGCEFEMVPDTNG
jgi:hypothetical protein